MGVIKEAALPGQVFEFGAGKTLASGQIIDLTTVKKLPPLRAPEKIICVGLNYRDHSAESGFKQPDYPTLF